MLINAVAVAVVLAIVGYVCGLVQRGGNQYVLAICCGAIGGLVVLLGYGPIALVIGALGAVAGWFHGKKDGSIQK